MALDIPRTSIRPETREDVELSAPLATSETDAKCTAACVERSKGASHEPTCHLSADRVTLATPCGTDALAEAAFPHPRAAPSKEFLYFTKYVPSLDQHLEAGAQRHEHIKQLCSLLKQGSWSKIFHAYAKAPDDLALDGLKAYHDDQISTEQFATLLSCRSLLKEFKDSDIYSLPMFDADGSVNPLARKIISETLVPKGKAEGNPDSLDKDQLELFFAHMRSQPTSETVLLYVKTDPYMWDQLDMTAISKEILMQSRTITKEIAVSIGFNVFHQFAQEDQSFRLVPSLSMMQQFLQVYARANHTVKITPVIGVSKPKDIKHNILTDTRDMGFGFPGRELPRSADQLLAPYSADFTAHDFYHAFIVTDIPQELRIAYKEFADALKEVQKQYSKDDEVQEFIKLLYERIIDMEHPFFRQKYPQAASLPTPNASIGVKFLFSISFQQLNAINRKITIEAQQNPEFVAEMEEHPEQKSDKLERFSFHLLQSNLMTNIAKQLCASGFCEKFNISLADIQALAELNAQSSAQILKFLERIESAYLPAEHPLRQTIEIDGKTMTKLDFQKLLIAQANKADLSSCILQQRRS